MGLSHPVKAKNTMGIGLTDLKLFYGKFYKMSY